MMQICYTASLSSFVDRYNSSSTPSVIQFSLHTLQRNPDATMWNCLLFTSMPVYDITHTPIIIVGGFSIPPLHEHTPLYYICVIDDDGADQTLHRGPNTENNKAAWFALHMSNAANEVVWVSIYEQHPPKAFLFTTVWIGDIHSQNG